MVVFGIDAHKHNHTVVAVNGGGEQLGQLQVQATPAGHLQLFSWAQSFGRGRFGVEDCRHLSRRLEADLLAAGAEVVRVPTKLMAGVRRSARTRGKSDPIDALAVARAVLREPDLPTAHLDGPARELKLVFDYRQGLVRERTGLQNRLRWRLHELRPGFDPPKGALDRYRVLDEIEALLSLEKGTVAELGRQETGRIRELTRGIKRLEKEMAAGVREIAPALLALPGVGAITAARLIGETADVTRFRHRDAYAMWTGTAPIPVWSGNEERFRLNRGGNRQVNSALHLIAVTQARCHPPARVFITRRLAGGDTRKEAIRALKRRLSDVVYRTLLAEAQTSRQSVSTRAA